MSTAIWPTEIRLTKDRRALVVTFDDGSGYTLAAEYLRVTSPSAEVQGHSPAERKTIGGKRDVEIIGVDEVGNYAVRLTFDDLHSSGIWTWTHLAELGRDHDAIWANYLAELAEKGLKRER
jgi:DUF971 family protein